MLRRYQLLYLFVVIACLCHGCNEMQDAMTQELAKQKEIPDVDRSAEKEEEQANRMRVVAESVTRQEPKIGPNDVVPAADPAGVEESEKFAPMFNGVQRHVVYLHREGRKTGVRFELWIGLIGNEKEISQYAFEVEIRDQSQGAMTFPMTRNDRTLVLKEVVLGAGIKEQYEYQVHYYVPGEEIDPETGKETRYVLLKDWGKFHLGS